MSVQGVLLESPRPSSLLAHRYGSQRGSRWWVPRLAVILVVFLVHFRPWQAGLLEEWGLAASWNAEGWSAYTARLPLFAGRPLHLLPHYVGLALPGEGFAGEYLVLGMVAAGQVVVAVWALSPIVQDSRVRWAVAAVLGLHPWWLAGDVLRFLPAQLSVLMFVVWLGGCIRFLRSGSARHLVMASVGLLLGFLTYQLLVLSAAAAVVLLVAVLRPDRRRSAAAVGATAGVVVLDVVHTLVVVPRLWPESYESSIRTGNLDAVDLVHDLARTTLTTVGLAGFLALVTVLVVVLGLGGAHRGMTAAPLLVALAMSPATALALAASPAQLNDPDRVGLPVGMTAWVVLVLAVTVPFAQRRIAVWGRLALAAVVVLSVVLAVVGWQRWSALASQQRALLDAVEQVRDETADRTELIVADHSGAYGDVYTLLPPYLQVAVTAEQPVGPTVVLCTPAGVERQHPDAQRYPIVTTPDCDSLPGFATAELIDSMDVDGRRVVFHAPID